MQVFQIASFELDDGGKVHNYLNPPEKTVEETLQTPVKTHISVKGILRKVSSSILSWQFLAFIQNNLLVALDYSNPPHLHKTNLSRNNSIVV